MGFFGKKRKDNGSMTSNEIVDYLVKKNYSDDKAMKMIDRNSEKRLKMNDKKYAKVYNREVDEINKKSR